MLDKSLERIHWDRGISTRFAKKLTTKDIREFLENELNVKCGRISRGIANEGYGVKFKVRKMSNLRYLLINRKSIDINYIFQKNRATFVAYDFNFDFVGERMISSKDKQKWINFMSKKFGKAYDEFMIVYTDEI